MLRYIAALFSLLWLNAAFAETPIPAAPKQWVTDQAGVLSQETKDTLTTSLQNYEAKSGHQILVWIDQTTGGAPIEDWAVRAFESWHVGRAGIDDGVVVFLFIEDRAVRIEVGYGLEGLLPDALASRIIREVTLPLAQKSDYDGAVRATIKQILSALGEEDSQGFLHEQEQAPVLIKAKIIVSIIGGLALLLLFLFRPSLALWILFSLMGRRGGGGGGDGGGFSGGGGRSGGGGASGRW